MERHRRRYSLPGLAPVLETDLMRTESLGFEGGADVGSIRCLEHGYPTPLARWHCHEEYELHLIIESSGVAYVGDWVGDFSPGHVVLCGPGLPHNWITLDCPPEGIARRDRGVLFPNVPVLSDTASIPELDEANRLLELSRYGIEFFGMAEAVSVGWERIRSAWGVERLARLYDLFAQLSRCKDYRVLNSVNYAPDLLSERLQGISAAIARDPGQALSAEEYAQDCNLGIQQFLRLFKRQAGMSFAAFIHQSRLNAARRLLETTELYVHEVCYAVGFNNLSNFNRRFLDANGHTPSDYRKLFQQVRVGHAGTRDTL